MQLLGLHCHWHSGEKDLVQVEHPIEYELEHSVHSFSSYSVCVILCIFFLVMASTSRINLKKDDDVYLVGKISHQIVGSKLPSNKEVLSVLFYNSRKVRLTLRESASLLYDEVSVFWQKARIPTRKKDRCIKVFQNLHHEWERLQKNATRETAGQKAKEQNFIDRLDDL